MLQGKREFMVSYLEDLQQAIENIDLGVIEEVLELLAKCREEGRFIWVMGNGGSALTASHFAVDLARALPTEGISALPCSASPKAWAPSPPTATTPATTTSSWSS